MIIRCNYYGIYAYKFVLNLLHCEEHEMLLALLNTLFTIHSKLPALKLCGDPFLTTSTSDYIA